MRLLVDDTVGTFASSTWTTASATSSDTSGAERVWLMAMRTAKSAIQMKSCSLTKRASGRSDKRLLSLTGLCHNVKYSLMPNPSALDRDRIVRPDAQAPDDPQASTPVPPEESFGDILTRTSPISERAVSKEP